MGGEGGMAGGYHPCGRAGPCWVWQSPSLLSPSQGFTQKTRKIRCGAEAVFGEVSALSSGEDQGSGHWGRDRDQDKVDPWSMPGGAGGK